MEERASPSISLKLQEGILRSHAYIQPQQGSISLSIAEAEWLGIPFWAHFPKVRMCPVMKCLLWHSAHLVQSSVPTDAAG